MSDVILTTSKGVRIELNATEALDLVELLGCMVGKNEDTCYDLYDKIVDLTHPNAILDLPGKRFKKVKIQRR